MTDRGVTDLLRRLWAEERPAVDLGTPPCGKREAFSGQVGNGKSSPVQRPSDTLPTFHTFPTELANGLTDRDSWEERAAILEFDAGYSRAEAERLARGGSDATRPDCRGAEEKSHE